jgi:ureidoacrylate peracid hydrolase
MPFPAIPERMALVNVDLQRFFVENAPQGRVIVERVNRLARQLRTLGVLVVHTSHVLRPDGSNVGVLGELVPSVVTSGFLYEGSSTAALDADLEIEAVDILLKKPRFGAFHGTDLELVLRQRGIDTIAISGIAIDVCCDTTAREANARDFRVFFLSDATAANEETPEEAEAVERSTLRTVEMFSEVITTQELLERIERDSTAGLA